jgi:NAD(P)H-dependent FMN reductase
MKVVIIVGSVRPGRQSHKIALHLEENLEERSIAVDLIDLADHSLPLLGASTEHSADLPQEIAQLSKRLQTADALLLVTPEYHGSFSGVLKNMLDYFWAEFHKKPIGVVAVSSGKMGGINASTQLQHIILSMGAFPLPLKLLIPEVQTAFDESLQLVNPAIRKSSTQFLDEYLWLADAVYQKKQKQEA